MIHDWHVVDDRSEECVTEILNLPAASALWTCLVLAMASATVSITITQTELFAPLRAWANRVHPMTGHLFHCFYCMSHWVVIAGIAIYRPVIISSGVLVIDWTVSALFTVALAALFSGAIFKAFLAAMAKKMKEIEVKKAMYAEG
jgi:hypothetical protein